MKKRTIAILVLVVLVVVPVVTRLPSRWGEVTAGMQRQDVYARLGQPASAYEQTKGTVRWRRELLVGRWEFDVTFRADDSVGAFRCRWRWSC
jgi:hypothetical protein